MIETRQGEGVGQAEIPEAGGNKNAGNERDRHGAYLPFGKGTKQANMAIHCAFAMKALMERMTDREDRSHQQQHRQQGGER